MLDIMPKLFLKALPRCANSRNLIILHFFLLKWTCETKFSTLGSCRKLLNEQNGVQFTFKVCFEIIKVVKGSHLVWSKVAFLKNTKDAAGICPFFLRCIPIPSKQRLKCSVHHGALHKASSQIIFSTVFCYVIRYLSNL